MNIDAKTNEILRTKKWCLEINPATGRVDFRAEPSIPTIDGEFAVAMLMAERMEAHSSACELSAAWKAQTDRVKKVLDEAGVPRLEGKSEMVLEARISLLARNSRRKAIQGADTDPKVGGVKDCG